MVMATMLCLLLLITVVSAGMMGSVLDIKSTTHYDSGNQAFAAAESGALHALSTINYRRVSNFQNDVVNSWGTLFGTSVQNMNGYPSVRYEVSVAADPTSPTEKGTMTATGYAWLSAKRVIKVGIKRSGHGSGLGAIYIASDAAASNFNGNAFLVDGNNHTTAGQLANDGIIVPGISAHVPSVASSVVSSLSTQQKDNVIGQGFTASPLTPSVIGTGGPSVTDLAAISAAVLGLPGVVTENDNKINGNVVYGTTALPKITHLTNPNVKINGNFSGAGILVADGNVSVSGNMTFTGWIIANGTVESLTTGNATIYGSVWTSGIQVQVGGSAIVAYCSNCLSLAEGLTGTTVLPRQVAVTSWQEVL